MSLTTNLKFAGLIAAIFCNSPVSAERALLNVSYDPTRELYQAYNREFIKYWQAKTGETITIQQSHGGAGKQARAVIDGLDADVLTLAISYDIDKIASTAKLLPANWQSRLPNHSLPYTSTMVFLVRKGNPQHIKNWDDLIKPSLSVITPNPKTSGGARYNYLAAWAYAEKNYGSKDAAKDFIKKLYKNVPVLDSGARGATTTFLQRGIGDVLLTWENEAYLALQEAPSGAVEIVVPPQSILAETPVALLDTIVNKKGTEDLAQAYLQYLYSPVGQTLAAKNHYRPANPELVDPALLANFPKLELFKVDEVFGSWDLVQKQHFDDGAIFDQIYVP
ncbi:MAG: sulfate ABC transporter substrate-binding protein [Methylococcaceae bacterium]|jgi:sulfate transport system substrate-binding protein